MDAVVQKVIDDVVVAAERHDATKENRLDRWRVLEPDAGRFLWVRPRVEARSIVEIGTSRGVSTLWLATPRTAPAVTCCRSTSTRPRSRTPGATWSRRGWPTT